ncbi:cytochrome P450 2A13-like [Callospermophilus lateralis]|uniref:cytochrome P450 2A13-like isoform X1 n=1 Tax=Callospermophilus lateralis TaxID=76772 RepID=UPI0040385822
MLASEILLVALLACLSMMVFKLVSQRSLQRKLPPGPTPLPFIGNYLQLDTNQMYNCLMKMSKHYGPVFKIHLGTRRVVVLCGYDAVKEALVDQAEEFSGRGQQATFDHLFKGYGVAFGNGERGKLLRRFSITTLRDFGVGKRGIEERIQEEAGFLIEALRGTHGAFIDTTFYLSKTVANVISSIVFGDRFDYEDKELLSLLQMIGRINKFAASPAGQLFDIFHSVMKYLPGPQQHIFKDMQGLEDFIAKKVEQNQRTLDPNSPRDFIDSFLIRMKEERNNPNTEFYMKNLIMTTLGLFFAGSETVSSTLRFGFLLLLKHPDVVAKVHEEIDRVIGRNRQPKFEDRTNMPYTEAVIHEIQRCANFAPMGVAHKVTKDTIFRDFLLPKDTEVFPMLGSLLNDPKFFSTPDDFNPQHFLDDKGQLKKIDADVPFSMGKRYCLGEGLARMELFLFLTTILQNFCFKSPKVPQDLDVSAKSLGFTRIITSYTIAFLPR